MAMSFDLRSFRMAILYYNQPFLTRDFRTFLRKSLALSDGLISFFTRAALRSTVSRQPVAHLSSASADRDFKMPKNPGTMRFSGVFLFVLFWLNLTQPNRFYRGQLGDNSPFFVFMGQLRGQPRGQLLGIFG